MDDQSPRNDAGGPIEPDQGGASAQKRQNLIQRILSSLVILPVALACLYYGGLAFTGLLTIVVAIMGWEWAGLVMRDPESFSNSRLIRRVCFCASLVAIAISLFGLLMNPSMAAIVSLGLALGILVISVVIRSSRLAWLGLGVPAVCIPVIATGWLREQSSAPIETLFWMIGLVVLTDIGGYVFGRNIGGPNLAPRLSPNKTWSGLLGGMLMAATFGAVIGFVSVGVNPISLGILSAGLAVVAQIGDLLESSVKRRFKAKDSGSIIPGHGGVLDRIDGQITVAPLVAALVALSGLSPLVW